MKKKRIYYKKKVSYFEPPKDKSEKQNDNPDLPKPEQEENEPENIYSAPILEPGNADPQVLAPEKD